MLLLMHSTEITREAPEANMMILTTISDSTEIKWESSKLFFLVLGFLAHKALLDRTKHGKKRNIQQTAGSMDLNPQR